MEIMRVYTFYTDQNFQADTKYVHLQGANGYYVGTTCSTLGYNSILTRNECIDAAREIHLIQGYSVNPGEFPCYPDKPNHCFTNTYHKTIYFTRANCSVHQGITNPEDSLICKKKGRL